MTKKNKTLIILAAVIVVAVGGLIIEYRQERKAKQKQPDQNKMDSNRIFQVRKAQPKQPDQNKMDFNRIYQVRKAQQEQPETTLPEWLSWSEGTGMTLDDIMHMMSDLAGLSYDEILRRINTWESAHIGDSNSSCPLREWARAAGVDVYDLIHMMSESTGVSENVIIEYMY